MTRRVNGALAVELRETKHGPERQGQRERNGFYIINVYIYYNKNRAGGEGPNK